MRFRAGIQNINIFSKLTASLSYLGNIAWLKLSDRDVRFTVVPEQGSQVWAVLQIDTIFDDTFTIQSAAPDNAINLEVPLQPLLRALKSAQNALGASIRLTKKDGIPLLSLTITTSSLGAQPAFADATDDNDDDDAHGYDPSRGSQAPDPPSTSTPTPTSFGASFSRSGQPDTSAVADHDTIVTQDVPIRVLAPTVVAGLHEPVCREPEVHIMLPSLLQLKNISDRFTKLALGGSGGSGGVGGAAGARRSKLVLAANMHGCLRLSLESDASSLSSTWTGLSNPELDPETVQGGERGVAEHPSTRMKRFGDAQGVSDEGWATVRVEGRDWGRVLGVGRLGGRVIACFCHNHALILYVYLAQGDEETESVLTYYITSYSA